MTSELKTCPFCGAEVPCLDKECPLNARATPSADPLAGLVRYSVPDRYDKLMPDGEYVLCSEAAKLIAAKDAEIDKQKDLTKTAEDFLYEVSRKLGNAEAELAQIKAQGGEA